MQLAISSQTSININGADPPYRIISLGEKNYRILNRQHSQYLNTTKTWAVFWLLLTCFSALLTLSILINLDIPYILIFAFFSCVTLTSYIHWHKNKVSKCIYYSSINLVVCFIPVVILSFLSIQQVLIPISLYIMVELIISCLYMQNKGQIIAKIICLFQLILISLKADQKIQSQWKEILLPLAILFLFLSICIFFMTFYILYLFFSKNQYHLFSQKIYGALFVYFNTIEFCIALAVPLVYTMFNLDLWITCLASSFMFSILTAYIWTFKNEIVIFFCNLSQIKSFGQIISFQEISGISQENIEQVSIQKTKKIQKKQFYRITQNWVTDKISKAISVLNDKQNPQIFTQGVQGTDISKNNITECLICFDSKAQIVWMPCGHLTVCAQCFNNMYQKKYINCVLCKKIPEQIFLVDMKKNISDKQKRIKPSACEGIQNSMSKQQDSINSTSVISIKERNTLSGNSKQDIASKSGLLSFRVLEGYNVKVI